MRGFVFLAMLCACSQDGRALRAWTLELDGNTQAVTLPSNLLAELPFEEVTYVLRTTVPLDASERGATLTLALDCYHGTLELETDGVTAEDSGDVSIGEHRFRLDPFRTARGQLELTLRPHRTWDPQSAIAVAPRLLRGARGRSATATFNRYSQIASLLLAVFLVFLCGCLYVFDRRQRAYATFAVGCVCTALLYCWLIGLTRWLGSFEAAATSVAFCGANISILQFIEITFALESPSRRWRRLWYVLLACGFLTPIGFDAEMALVGVVLPTYLVFGVFMMVRLYGLARIPAHRLDAWILLVGYAVLWLGSSFEFVESTIGHNLLGGVHVTAFNATLLLSFAVVMSRQHMARVREVELANAALQRTAKELQHQVAERSRGLAAALSALKAQPQAEDLGRTIDGRYRVVRRLGSGGMGVVHEVERLSDGKHLALKALRGEANTDAMSRFAREAQIAAELEHPNLLPVIDVGIADGSLFLVMALVEGGSLEHVRQRWGDVAWAKPVLVQIARGLVFLHEQGIVHRDLKPANVLLDDGIVRIADFGLASLCDAAPSRTLSALLPIGEAKTVPLALTNEGQIFGTPAYMAPELANGSKDSSAAVDVFAFGVLACELLTGRRPFEEPPVLTRMADRPIDKARCDAIALPWRNIVQCCLALEPGDRPRAGDLETLLAAGS